MLTACPRLAPTPSSCVALGDINRSSFLVIFFHGSVQDSFGLSTVCPTRPWKEKAEFNGLPGYTLIPLHMYLQSQAMAQRICAPDKDMCRAQPIQGMSNAILITDHCKSRYRQLGRYMTQLSARCLQSKLLSPNSIPPAWLYHTLKVSLPEAVTKRQQEPCMCWPGWALEGHLLLSGLLKKVYHCAACTATAEHVVRLDHEVTLLSAHFDRESGAQCKAGLLDKGIFVTGAVLCCSAPCR